MKTMGKPIMDEGVLQHLLESCVDVHGSASSGNGGGNIIAAGKTGNTE